MPIQNPTFTNFDKGIGIFTTINTLPIPFSNTNKKKLLSSTYFSIFLNAIENFDAPITLKSCMYVSRKLS